MSKNSRTQHYAQWITGRRAYVRRLEDIVSSGLAASRETQLRGTQASLEEGETRILQRIAGLKSEFLSIADFHKLGVLDPISVKGGPSPIPYTDLAEDLLARRFKVAEWLSGAAGTLIAGGLFVTTIAAPTHTVLPLGIALMAALTGAGASALVATSNSDPRRPECRSRLTRLAGWFGGVAAVSLGTILMLRFAGNIQTLEMIGIPLTVFEISLFGLSGVFAGLSVYYSWSRRITERYDAALNELTEVRDQLARVAVDLMELQFNRDMDDAQNATAEKVVEEEFK